MYCAPSTAGILNFNISTLERSVDNPSPKLYETGKYVKIFFKIEK